jgi:hypothetical protein
MRDCFNIFYEIIWITHLKNVPFWASVLKYGSSSYFHQCRPFNLQKFVNHRRWALLKYNENFRKNYLATIARSYKQINLPNIF